jgi:uncharacterized membrane protein YphA (DoxX/SURF4 family)
MTIPKSKQKWVALLLRVGLASVFAYAAISSFVTPSDWVGFLPRFALHIGSTEVLLKLFSSFEIMLALWLLSGKLVKYAALVSAVLLAGIVVLNPKLLPITFRDVGLAFAAAALWFTQE